MRFTGRIKSPKKSEHAHNSDAKFKYEFKLSMYVFFDNEIIAQRVMWFRNVWLLLHDIFASICYALQLQYALC